MNPNLLSIEFFWLGEGYEGSCSDNDSDPLNVFSERVVTLDLKPKEVRELKNRFKPLNSSFWALMRYGVHQQISRTSATW